MRRNKFKRILSGLLAFIVVLTSSNLSCIGSVFAADIPSDHPVLFSLAWDDTTVDNATQIDGSTMTLIPYNDSGEDTTGGTTAKLVMDYTLGSYDNGDGVMVPYNAKP